MIINKLYKMQEQNNKLIIDGSMPQEIRLALVDEDNNLLEYNTLGNQPQLVGNIYLGFIEKVEPSINVAFVNYGNHSNGFLSLNDIHPDYQKASLFRKSNQISKLVKKGQPVIVQVSREPSDTKAATLTTYVALTGKNCIFFPKTSDGHGISKRITGERRKKFKEFLTKLDDKSSLIIRTASNSADLKEIQLEYTQLKNYWEQLVKKTKNQIKPMLLLEEEPLLKHLRAYSKNMVKTVYIENKPLFDKIKEYSKKNLIYFPDIVNNKNVFDKIAKQVNQLYSTSVNLPSGGEIIIEHTQALTTIDINSRTSLKEKNMENTAFKTNIEAVSECAKQIILRNIGGIIVIDFIDMSDEENIKTLNKALKHAFKNDKASSKIIGYSPLGLVQISRQRINTSLMQKHFETCKMCNGRGKHLNEQAQTYNLLRNLSNHPTKQSLIIHTSCEIIQIILGDFYPQIKDYKKLNWRITDPLDQMYNKIEITK